MAELTPQERLQPSLLDRLTDHEPEQLRESRDKRVISAAQLREYVTRDLSWLLNCTRHWSRDVPDDASEAVHSVVNFGVPDLTGTALSGIHAEVLQNRIRAAIEDFEPRLIGGTLQVTVDVDPGRMDSRSLSFRIVSEMWAQPQPMNLYLRTDLDLETGEFSVAQEGG